MRRLFSRSLLLVLAAASHAALAEDPPGPARLDAFGSDLNVLVIPGLTFHPQYSLTEFAQEGGLHFSLYHLGGPPSFAAPVELDSGSLIVGVEAEACDDSPTGRLLVGLLSCPVPVVDCLSVGGGIDTGAASVPGCSFFSMNILPGHRVDNFNRTLMLNAVFLDSITSAVRLRAVRVLWRREVSPAPSTATFGDVPTSHPFFRFVEALYDAGITAGCGGGNYCPDQPVTRGQMAVFLSEALGLHWPL